MTKDDKLLINSPVTIHEKPSEIRVPVVINQGDVHVRTPDVNVGQPIFNIGQPTVNVTPPVVNVYVTTNNSCCCCGSCKPNTSFSIRGLVGPIVATGTLIDVGGTTNAAINAEVGPILAFGNLHNSGFPAEDFAVSASVGPITANGSVTQGPDFAGNASAGPISATGSLTNSTPFTPFNNQNGVGTSSGSTSSPTLPATLLGNFTVIAIRFACNLSGSVSGITMPDADCTLPTNCLFLGLGFVYLLPQQFARLWRTT